MRAQSPTELSPKPYYVKTIKNKGMAVFDAINSALERPVVRTHSKCAKESFYETKYLRLSYAGLTDEDVEFLFYNIYLSPNCRYIDLRGNKITDRGLKAILVGLDLHALIFEVLLDSNPCSTSREIRAVRAKIRRNAELVKIKLNSTTAYEQSGSLNNGLYVNGMPGIKRYNYLDAAIVLYKHQGTIESDLYGLVRDSELNKVAETTLELKKDVLPILPLNQFFKTFLHYVTNVSMSNFGYPGCYSYIVKGVSVAITYYCFGASRHPTEAYLPQKPWCWTFAPDISSTGLTAFFMVAEHMGFWSTRGQRDNYRLHMNGRHFLPYLIKQKCDFKGAGPKIKEFIKKEKIQHSIYAQLIKGGELPGNEVQSLMLPWYAHRPSRRHGLKKQRAALYHSEITAQLKTNTTIQYLSLTFKDNMITTADIDWMVNILHENETILEVVALHQKPNAKQKYAGMSEQNETYLKQKLQRDEIDVPFIYHSPRQYRPGSYARLNETLQMSANSQLQRRVTEVESDQIPGDLPSAPPLAHIKQQEEEVWRAAEIRQGYLPSAPPPSNDPTPLPTPSSSPPGSRRTSMGGHRTVRRTPEELAAIARWKQSLVTNFGTSQLSSVANQPQMSAPTYPTLSSSNVG